MRDANPVRLLILGLLADGPLHGHQIRRTAELSGIETWAGVKVGALYGMLHRLAAEDLIEPVRTEQDGNRPQRTVYAITAAGRAELAVHRDRALTQPAVQSNTVEAALKWPGGLGIAGLRDRLAQRRAAVESRLAELVAGRDLHQREDHLSVASLAGYRRAELHLQAELAWHEELDAMLPAIAAGDPRDRSGGGESAAEVTPIGTSRARRTDAS